MASWEVNRSTISQGSLNFSKSYAEALSLGCSSSIPSSSRFTAQPPRRWHKPKGSDVVCYRCGGLNHMARECREPIRCFSCGKFGHKKANCTVFKAPAPSVKPAALHQAWSSMISSEDFHVADLPMDRKALSEEHFLFCGKYLKVRKSLIYPGITDIYAAMSWIDGMFNAYDKIHSLASHLLASSADDVADPFKLRKFKLPVTDSVLIEKTETHRSDEILKTDSLLLDPDVELCLSASSYFGCVAGKSSGVQLDLSNHVLDTSLTCGISTSACPVSSGGIVSPTMSISDLGSKTACFGYNAVTLATNSDLLACADDTVRTVSGPGPYKPGNLIDYGNDRLAPSKRLDGHPKSVGSLNTELILFNSFELLDFCLDEEGSRELVVGCESDPYVGLKSCVDSSEEPQASDSEIISIVGNDVDKNFSSTDMNALQVGKESFAVKNAFYKNSDKIGNAHFQSCSGVFADDKNAYADCANNNNFGIHKSAITLPLNYNHEAYAKLNDITQYQSCRGDVNTCVSKVQYCCGSFLVGNSFLKKQSSPMREASVASEECLDDGDLLVSAAPNAPGEDVGFLSSESRGQLVSSDTLEGSLSGLLPALCASGLEAVSGLDSSLQAVNCMGPHVGSGCVSDPNLDSGSRRAAEDDSCMVTPPCIVRRGRKKRGFYERSIVRRSARLGGSCDRAFGSGGLPESGADSTSDSGAGMTSFLGSTYSPRALNSLTTTDMLFLARNSGFTFDDTQIDSDYIRAKEMERVNSFSS